MKVTVFGGAGFLGSHTADALSDAGYQVTIFDTQTSPYLRDDQEMIVGDILDFEAVEKAVNGLEAVYNFAALANIDTTSTMPADTARVNILGNLNVLEAAKRAKVKRFIFSSSVYVYSDRGSFYRCSKQACELYIENYQKEYGLDYTIVRYGSLYGTRCDEYNSIVRMLTQAIKEKKIVWKGDGEEVREYVHVLDAARIGTELLDDKFKNQHVIITGNEQMKIKDLLTMIKEMLKGEIQIEYVPAEQNMHYEITPYVFQPKMACKVKSTTHIDMGNGILEVLTKIHSQESKKV